MRRPAGRLAGARDSVITSASHVPRCLTVAALVDDHAVEEADGLRGAAKRGGGVRQRLVLISAKDRKVLLFAGPLHQLYAAGKGELHKALLILPVHEASAPQRCVGIFDQVE